MKKTRKKKFQKNQVPQYTCKISFASPKPHDPFFVRQALVLCGLFLGIPVAYFLESFLMGMVVYFVVVTFGDALNHFVLKLKPSSYADPEQLLESQWVTADELDAYLQTRTYIRFASFGTAIVVLGISSFSTVYGLEGFCIAYGTATILGILYVRLFVPIRRPRIIYRDDRYYVPYHGPRPGYITMAQFALASSGSYPYGPVDS